MATKRKKEKIKRNGVLYVSKGEFARQMGVSWQAVNYMVKSGQIATTEIDGDAYIDVDKWGEWYKEHLKKSKRGGRGRTQREKKNGGYQNLPQQGGKSSSKKKLEFEFIEPAPKISSGKVPDEKVNDVDDVAIRQFKENSGLSFDDDIFSDCWIWSEELGDWIYNKTTGEHLLDLDMADKKMKLIIHRQQYLREAGKLILKEDVDYTLRSLATPLVNSLSTIPDKFIVRIASYIERVSGIKVDGQKMSNIKEELKDEVSNIIHSLEMTIRSTLGEEEGEDEE